MEGRQGARAEVPAWGLRDVLQDVHEGHDVPSPWPRPGRDYTRTKRLNWNRWIFPPGVRWFSWFQSTRREAPGTS